MITLKQAHALQPRDRVSYTPTPVAGEPPDPPVLGTVTVVLPSFNMPYRTVPPRIIIDWDNDYGRASVTLYPDSQSFWDCISILD